MRTRFGLLAVAALAILVLATACETSETVQVLPGGAQFEGLSVTGIGEASAAPDLALLTLGVSVEAHSVKEARETAAEAMNDVIDSLKDNGVSDEDIQTQRFSIQPLFDYRDGEQKLRGFQVTNVVTAKLRDLDAVGDVIDDAAAAGGDLVRVDRLTFTIDDPDELRAEAREAAVAEARQKAEVLADLAGVQLGKPVSISEEGLAPSPPVLFEAAPLARGGEAQTPVEVGELEVSVTVSIVFAIE